MAAVSNGTALLGVMASPDWRVVAVQGVFTLLSTVLALLLKARSKRLHSRPYRGRKPRANSGKGNNQKQ